MKLERGELGCPPGERVGAVAEYISQGSFFYSLLPHPCACVVVQTYYICSQKPAF
jgi:hypothetical protein